jgi:hypothetical protein
MTDHCNGGRLAPTVRERAIGWASEWAIENAFELACGTGNGEALEQGPCCD